MISLKGAEIARYELPQGCELAIPVGKADAAAGRQADPRAGLRHDRLVDARGTGRSARGAADTPWWTRSACWERTSPKSIRRYAHELFSRQDAKKLLDRVAIEHPKVVEDLVPKLLPLATVQRVLQNLLRERVSIRDAVTILEALGEAAVTTRNPVLLTEYVRQSIRRIVVKPYPERRRRPAGLPPGPVARADGGIGRAARRAEQPSDPGAAGHSRPAAAHQQKVGTPETPVAVIASSGARYFLRQMAEPTHSQSVLHFAQRSTDGSQNRFSGSDSVAMACDEISPNSSS